MNGWLPAAVGDKFPLHVHKFAPDLDSYRQAAYDLVGDVTNCQRGDKGAGARRMGADSSKGLARQALQPLETREQRYGISASRKGFDCWDAARYLACSQFDTR